MQSLGEELRKHSDEIVARWYEIWRSTPRSHPDIEEAALKNSLSDQLQLIGEQLRDLRSAEDPNEIWQITERLDPEKRVDQKMPIQEVVQEYELAVDVVRRWVEEREIEVPFLEFSYFHKSIFELVAESIRRYSDYQKEVIRKDRAHYLASVMHQIRSPLSAVSMQVDLLHEDDRGADSEAVARLQRNIRRISTLVDGILRLERFETWEVPVHPEDVHPAHLIDDIMSDHEIQALSKGLRFESHVNRSLRMRLDPDLFLDALGNLVHNAIKFTDDGFVIVEMKEHDGEVEFCVRDSGPGVDPEQREGLLTHTQPGSKGGAGLGLQIAQHAARAQGGRIELDGAVDEGLSVSLVLPKVVSLQEQD